MKNRSPPSTTGTTGEGIDAGVLAGFVAPGGETRYANAETGGAGNVAGGVPPPALEFGRN